MRKRSAPDGCSLLALLATVHRRRWRGTDRFHAEGILLVSRSAASNKTGTARTARKKSHSGSRPASTPSLLTLAEPTDARPSNQGGGAFANDGFESFTWFSLPATLWLSSGTHPESGSGGRASASSVLVADAVWLKQYAGLGLVLADVCECRRGSAGDAYRAWRSRLRGRVRGVRSADAGRVRWCA
jgi:hypothetical protein